MSARDGAEVGPDVLAPLVGELAEHGWVAVADVHLDGRRQPSIDVVLVGPGGVVVVDAVTWTRPVVVTDGAPRPDRVVLDHEAAAAIGATVAVAARIPAEQGVVVFGVICLTNRDQAAVMTPAGVYVVGRAQLASFLRGLRPSLGPGDVTDLGRRLRRSLAAPSFPTRTEGAAAYAKVSRSSGRPERSAQVPLPTRPVRAPSRAQTATDTARDRGPSTGGRLLLALAAGVLVLTLALNAPALVDALGMLFGSS